MRMPWSKGTPDLVPSNPEDLMEFRPGMIIPMEPRRTATEVMMQSHNIHRFLSRPIPVHFAGWESSTDRLQRCGWRMAIDKDHRNMTYRFLLEHPYLRLAGWCDSWSMDRSYEEWVDPSNRFNPMPIEMGQVMPADHFQMRISGELGMQWIDASPEIVHEQITTLADLGIFKLAEAEVPKVFVEEADMSVVDHLQSILDGQADKQAELREKARSTGDRVAKATTSKIIQQIVQV